MGTAEVAMAAYEATRDPRLLKVIHQFKEAVAVTPVRKFVLPHYTQMGWYRLVNYTRDPRLVERLKEQWDDGNSKHRYGLGSGITRLLLYRLTGDRRIAASLTHRRDRIRGVATHPPSFSHSLMNMPYVMSLLADVGAAGDVLSDRGAWKRFWKVDVDGWQKEGKKLYGEPIR